MKAYNRNMYILTLYSVSGFGSYRDLRKEKGRVMCVQQSILLGCLFWEHKVREEKAAYMCLHVASWLRDNNLTKSHCHQGGLKGSLF